MPNRSRLYILVSLFVGLLILLTVVYLVGLARGRADIGQAVATAQAQALLAQIVATDTPSATPTQTGTPTITPTATDTPTPEPSPTPSPTPASPEEWATRFLEQSLLGLNALTGFEFTPNRAEALVRSSAQQQALVLAPVSYHTLAQAPWAALVVPRTPDGKALPMLFWQEPNDQNRVRGQLLLDLLGAANDGAANDGAAGDGTVGDGSGERNYSLLRSGVSEGILRSDPQGHFYALLIERPGDVPLLPIYLLAQPSPAADFALLWSSRNEPLWSVAAEGSTVILDPRDDNFLPDLVVDAPLPAGGPLREVVRAPGTFVEQPPFARQWANSRWTPSAFGNLAEGGTIGGYRLQNAGLRSSPLTSMAQILALLQAGTVDTALTYAQRLDLIQQAFGLGLAQPGWWMGVYLDDSGNEIYDARITPRLRFFDNGDRTRTFDAAFDLDASGFYRLSALQQAPSYAGERVTPAAPLPTFTPTLETTEESTETPTPETAAINTPTPSPTALPVGAPTPTPTPTETATPEPTPPPTDTPPPSATVTPTETPIPTETPTPTETPLPIPEIPSGLLPPAGGVTNVSEPARLRGGPGTDFPVLVPVGNALRLGIFGITEAGDWLLVRLDEPGHPNLGLVGWMARNLIFSENDLGLLPLYRADGTPVEAEPTAEPAAPLLPGLPTNTPTPEPSPTPTPLQTPQVLLPGVEELNLVAAPEPGSGEALLTIAGDALPADPLAPLAAVAADGSEATLDVQSAAVEIWGGLVGSVGGWLPAPGELLWPGTQVHARIVADRGDGTLTADRVRIVAAPPVERVALVDGAALAAAAAEESAVALVSSGAGVDLLTRNGNVASLFPGGSSAAWLTSSSAPAAGIVAPLQSARYGQEGFVWLRVDGAGLRVQTRPYFALGGVAGDPYIGLWWIERPATGGAHWQLWQWDPAAERIVRRLVDDGALLAVGSPQGTSEPSARAPRLLAVRPRQPGDQSIVTLLLETADALTQQPNQGLFAVDLLIPPDGPGSVQGAPRLLLQPGTYQSPLALSPDQSRLAYAVYDDEHPSLTAGQVRPANRVLLLVLEGPNAGSASPIYEAQTALEFLAPLLTWQDEDTLLAARSRFSAAGTVGLDLFAAVWIELPPSEGAPDAAAISTTIPPRQTLLDLTGCRDDESALLVLLDDDSSLHYARWNVVQPPAAVFTLPNNLTDAFLCWRLPIP